MKKHLFCLLLPTLIAFATLTLAQDRPAPLAQPPSSDQDVTPMDQIPTFKVNVIGRTTKAVNYHFHSGGTNILIADGSVRFLKATVSLEVVIALLTRSIGEVLPQDAY